MPIKDVTVNKLKAARQGGMLSQGELADAMGVSTAYISQIERGAVCPDHLAKKIARYFDCAIADLFEADPATKYRVRREGKKDKVKR